MKQKLNKENKEDKYFILLDKVRIYTIEHLKLSKTLSREK